MAQTVVLLLALIGSLASAFEFNVTNRIVTSWGAPLSGGFSSTLQMVSVKYTWN